MPLDGIVLSKVIRELNSEIVGKTIKNIYQPINDQILFQLNKKNLLFSLQNPCYLVLLEEKPDVPDTPFNFSQALRKKLKSGRIVSINQIELDRVGYIEIENFDHIGNFRRFKLYFELMGKNSNLILVDENNIIEDVFKKFMSEDRTLFPGAKYSYYFDNSQKNIFNLDRSNEPLENLMGFSNKSLKFLNIIGYNEVIDSLKKDELYYYTEFSKPDVSAVRPGIYEYELLSPSYALLKLFKNKADHSRLSQQKKSAEKYLIREIEKKEKIKINLLKDLKECENIESLTKKGELLQGYLYTMKKGDEYAIVKDWATDEDVKISLDPLKSPSENLEKVFKRVKKLKTKKDMSEKRFKKTGDELEYLFQLWSVLDNCDDIDTMAEIHEEMIQEKIIPEHKKLKSRKKNISTIRKFNFKDFEIVNGKNNKQNDDISKSASKKDIWLHTQNIPGSHTVIKSAGKEIPYEVIEYAARISATYSKAKMSANVPIDYTFVSNIWKPKGAKPGMWLYKNYKTIITNPLMD